MTTDPSQAGEPNAEPTRRKFDDIASLFGTIVPAPGASPFPPHRPAFIPVPPASAVPSPRPNPQSDPEPAPEPSEPELSPELSEELARTVHITTVPKAAAPTRIEPTLSLRAAPTPSPRPRPAEIPWPDAFEPRPNYRKREPRNWSWLLLIPAGLVAAAAITMVDARAVRTWIDTTILHRTPVVATTESSLLPLPFRNPPASDTPPVQAPNPYPAIPTSPPPVPPGTEVSPPPADPVDAAAAAAAPIRVTIQFRRNIPGADGEARRIAALLQSYGGSIELHPNVTTVRAATINYYSPADKDAAAALASVLANEAASWIVRLGTNKNPPGTLDVWLP